MHTAARFGNLNFVKFFLSNGANVNLTRIWDKKSPLHVAVENHHLEVVEYLIDHGANLNQKDSQGHEPLCYVTMLKGYEKDEIYKFLEPKYMALRNSSKEKSYIPKKRSIGTCTIPEQNENSEILSSKSRKIMVHKNTSTDELTNVNYEEANASNEIVTQRNETGNIENESSDNQKPNSSDDVLMIVKPTKELFLKKTVSYSLKMTCISSIDAILSRNPNVCQHIAKKEVIDEIANLVSEIVSNELQGQSKKDFEIIARILAKLNTTREGEKLISDMKLSYGAFMKLRSEMKKFEFNPDHTQFAFDSDCSSSKKFKYELN